MKNPDKFTSIRVHESTKKRLAQQGSKGESYEDIILRLAGPQENHCPKCGNNQLVSMTDHGLPYPLIWYCPACGGKFNQKDGAEVKE